MLDIPKVSRDSGLTNVVQHADLMFLAVDPNTLNSPTNDIANSYGL